MTAPRRGDRLHRLTERYDGQRHPLLLGDAVSL